MQQGRIFLIGFPCYIKDIARNRDGSYHGVNADVGDHPEEHDFRRAQSYRLIKNIGGQECPHSVTHPRNQAEQAVETNALGRTRNAKLFIEEAAQYTYALESC